MSTDENKKLHVPLWVVQGVLAAAFGMSGAMKLVTPVADLAAKMAWAQSTSEMMVRFIGAAEVAGALGLVLPSALRIAPKLTAVAAGALTLVMILAAGKHISIGEPQMIVPNIVLGGLAIFVAWGRGVKAPIAPKQ